MKSFTVFSVLVLFVVCGVMGLFCGCETNSDGQYLTVSPAAATTSNSSAAVTFEVGGSTNTTSDSGLRTLSLPLEWWVGNPSLGSISSSTGTTAIYVRSSRDGIQTIHVRDQYGAEGEATVDQQ